MKKHLLVLTTYLLTLTVGHSQTNVSGGIFSNTTWTKANSPYIVTGNVVVFPGVFLIIQPGVTVKFNSGTLLEVRQAQIIAEGLSTDSITFTSNSASPTPGIWSEIYLNGGNLQQKFNYCNFSYASKGINNVLVDSDTLVIKNSKFNYNVNGIEFGYNYGKIDSCSFISNTGNGIKQGANRVNYCTFLLNYIGADMVCGGTFMPSFTNCVFNSNNIGINKLEYSIVDNCNISNNQYGIKRSSMCGFYGHSVIKNSTIDSNSVCGLIISVYDSVMDCQIKNNKIGLTDSLGNGLNVITKCSIENNIVGIKFWKSNEIIYCNKICNNSSYDLYYNNINNCNVSNNNWCTPDSASTELVIYDGYDNINLGLVYFMPLDTTCSPNITTAISEIKIFGTSVFPNPFSEQTVLQLDKFLHNATLTVDNVFGQTVKKIKNINGQKITLHRDNLLSGLYFIHLTEDSKVIATKKLLITD